MPTLPSFTTLAAAVRDHFDLSQAEIARYLGGGRRLVMRRGPCTAFRCPVGLWVRTGILTHPAPKDGLDFFERLTYICFTVSSLFVMAPVTPFACSPKRADSRFAFFPVVCTLMAAASLILAGSAAAQCRCLSGNCSNGFGKKSIGKDLYEGNFKDRLMDGYGKYTFADGGKYEGDWVNGNQHGKGTLTFADGDKYEGDWVNGKKHGKGTLTFADGDEYEGDWVNGKKHGKGTLTFADGDKYEGDWVNGKQHGKGTLTFADGSKYEGDWVNGNPHGKGTLTFASGTKYEGDWVDGEKHGLGKMVFYNGPVQQGTWDKDVFTGK